MDIARILSLTDHTNLKPNSTWAEIKKLCDEGMKFQTASVCIPPGFVQKANEYVNGNLCICTVIGFPCGYNTISVKIFEIKNAISDGADELDVVVNIGNIKSQNHTNVLHEIKELSEICHSKHKIIKVIIETCLLTNDEKKRMCEIVSIAGADFIKTSTGFSTSGATKQDIILFKKHLDSKVKIKAAGGIKSLEDAEIFINFGADRIGTSKIVSLAQMIR